jgi:peroxiredoxin
MPIPKRLKVADRILLPVILLCLNGWITCPGCAGEEKARIGDVAQNFSLPDLTGRVISLDRFQGQNVFLFFWTSGCVFCQTRQIVHVNEIYQQGRRANLAVLSINIAESKGDVSEFVKQKGLIFPVLLDRDASVSRNKYDVYIVPTLFIIGPEGRIREKVSGFLTQETLVAFLAPYLAKGK